MLDVLSTRSLHFNPPPTSSRALPFNPSHQTNKVNSSVSCCPVAIALRSFSTLTIGDLRFL